MLFKPYKQIIFTAFISGVLFFCVGYWASDSLFFQQVMKKPFDRLETGVFRLETVKKTPGYVRLREQVYYQKCRHLVNREVDKEDLLYGLSIEELKAQGWSVYENGDETVIFKLVNEVCPEDKKKRHLGAAGDYVAVFEGPVGVAGEQIEVLDVLVDSLPVEWQVKVRQGELGFVSEADLLQALDSIDEYE